MIIRLKGTQILAEALKQEGVEVIFGFPGGAVIDIYDELIRTDIRNVIVRHEQGAVHAADGYARISGRVGVSLVTSGPGATNTVSGIASAYMDSIPLVVLSGQVPTNLIGNDAFQEVDITGITRPCTKHNYIVRDTGELARTLREAFHIAASGRPGPVLVDLPKDVMQTSADYTPLKRLSLRSYKPNYKPSFRQLSKAVKLIKKAERPLVFAGGGVLLSRASEELDRLARRVNAPVTSTLMGIGAFPGTDPLWLGMIGMHGTYAANICSSECDLLIAVGVRFDDRVTGRSDAFAKNAEIIHIDIDPTSIGKNIPVSIPVVGDCRITLQKLNSLLDQEEPKGPVKERSPWMERVKELKETRPLSYEKCEKIKPQYVIEKLYEATAGEAIITTEVGQNQMWAAQYYHFDRPRNFVTSGGLGCMGFGFPAAIGAQIARPDKLVVDIAGDGSLQMNIQEMATAVQYKLPVKVVLLNNKYLGMVRQWQELFYEGRYAFTKVEHAPDFVRLAEAYGAVGLRAETSGEVQYVLEKGLSVHRPVIMEFLVSPEECVYPMVPAGSPITEMLLV